MAKKMDDHLGVGPLSVTVANEGFQEAPTEYVNKSWWLLSSWEGAS